MIHTEEKAQLLKRIHIEQQNEMQIATEKAIDRGKDVMVLSATGSGKTFAFLIPLLFKLQKETKQAQLLVIVPSRELALQIEQVFRQFQSGFKVSCIYGGHSTKTE